MKKILVAAVLVASIASAHAFDLKGIATVGKPVDVTALAKAGIACDTNDECDGLTTYGSGTLRVMIQHKSGGPINMIAGLFKTMQFREIKAGLLKKFGSPASDVSIPAQNGLGLPVTIELLTWKNAAGDTLVLTSVISDGIHGGFTMESAAASQKEAAKSKVAEANF